MELGLSEGCRGRKYAERLISDVEVAYQEGTNEETRKLIEDFGRRSEAGE